MLQVEKAQIKVIQIGESFDDEEATNNNDENANVHTSDEVYDAMLNENGEIADEFTGDFSSKNNELMIMIIFHHLK